MRERRELASYLYKVDRTAQDSFLSLAIEYGSTEYVSAELEKDKFVVDRGNGRPLLDYIASATESPDPDMNRLLLRDTGDPNRRE